MPQTLDPVLIGPDPQTIQMPQSPAAPVGLVVANESPWALQLIWGFESVWLDPWTADVVANTPDNWHRLQVVPLQQIPTPNMAPPASLMLITVYFAGERIVGSWPATLSRESSITNLDALGEAIADRTAQAISAALLPPIEAIEIAVGQILDCVCDGGGGNEGGGAEVNVQEFRTPGDFEATIPEGATLVHFRVLGAGSGGASGDRQPSGTQSNGGRGGVGGFYQEFWIPAALLPNPLPLTVGAGGAGAPSILTDSTAGTFGAPGGNSLLGAGGAFGVGLGGGRNGAAGPGNGGGLANLPAQNQGTATVPGTAVNWSGSAAGGQAVAANGNGGGQGGSISTATALIAPGPGGSLIGSGQAPNFYNPPFPLPNVPMVGSPSSSGQFAGTGGGGGAASLTGEGTAGFAGAAGSGGGGGGASLNGEASGAGGNGGDGFVVVESFLG